MALDSGLLGTRLAVSVPKNLGRGCSRMVRGFSRIATVRVDAHIRDPKELVYPRKSAKIRVQAFRVSRIPRGKIRAFLDANDANRRRESKPLGATTPRTGQVCVPWERPRDASRARSFPGAFTKKKMAHWVERSSSATRLDSTALAESRPPRPAPRAPNRASPASTLPVSRRAFSPS